MSNKKYAVFLRAVELGSLSKAAEDLGYTQPGVSHIIKSLEDEVGFPLLIRTASGIQPNEAGKLLLPMMRELLGLQENLDQAIARLNGLETGNIRIAAFSSAAVSWLPHIIRTFQHDYPHINIQIIEGGVNTIEELMDNREVDFCIYAGGSHHRFEWLPLCDDPLLAVLPASHPLASAQEYPIEAFKDEHFIVPLAGFDYDVHNVLDQLEAYPPIKFSSCNDYVIVSMVAAGLGVTIIPELILENFVSPVVALPMRPGFHRTLGVGIPQPAALSPAARRFIEYVKRHVRQRVSSPAACP